MRHLVLLLVLAACQPPAVTGPQPWLVTPDRAAVGTYQARVTIADAATGQVLGMATGTAWAFRSYATKQYQTVLMTAGHLCTPDEGQAITDVQLVSRDGLIYSAAVLTSSMSPDLCTLVTETWLGGVLPIAMSDPGWSEEVAYVGAPLGLWGDGVVPLYFGRYMGGEMINAPVAPGASGSAVFSAGGVVGVVVAVHRRFHVAGWIVTRAQMLAHIDEIEDRLRALR